MWTRIQCVALLLCLISQASSLDLTGGRRATAPFRNSRQTSNTGVSDKKPEVGALYSAPTKNKPDAVPVALYSAPEGEGTDEGTTERSSTDSNDEGVSIDYQQYTEKINVEDEVTESPDLSYIPPSDESSSGGYGGIDNVKTRPKDQLPIENKVYPSHLPVEIHVIPPNLQQAYQRQQGRDSYLPPSNPPRREQESKIKNQGYGGQQGKEQKSTKERIQAAPQRPLTTPFELPKRDDEPSYDQFAGKQAQISRDEEVNQNQLQGYNQGTFGEQGYPQGQNNNFPNVKQNYQVSSFPSGQYEASQQPQQYDQPQNRENPSQQYGTTDYFTETNQISNQPLQVFGSQNLPFNEGGYQGDNQSQNSQPSQQYGAPQQFSGNSQVQNYEQPEKFTQTRDQPDGYNQAQEFVPQQNQNRANPEIKYGGFRATQTQQSEEYRPAAVSQQTQNQQFEGYNNPNSQYPSQQYEQRQNNPDPGQRYEGQAQPEQFNQGYNHQVNRNQPTPVQYNAPEAPKGREIEEPQQYRSVQPSASPARQFQSGSWNDQEPVRSEPKPNHQSKELAIPIFRTEELEGLNGKIVDSELLDRVQRIIEEHERQQKALFQSSFPSPQSFFASPSPPAAGYGFPTEQTHDSYPSNTQLEAREQPEQVQQRPADYSKQLNQAQRPKSIGEGDVEYQRAVLSNHFIQTEPISSPVYNSPSQQQNTNPNRPAIQTPDYFSGFNSPSNNNNNNNNFGSINVQAGYQIGSSNPYTGAEQRNGFTPLTGQAQRIEFSPKFETPRPVYGIPLAPVIGLDSNENLSDGIIVDAKSGQNNDLSYSFPQSTGGYLGPQRNLFRRRVATVTKLR